MEQRANCDELDEDGESQWHHLERKFGSVNKERCYFVHLSVPRLVASLLVIMVEQEQFCVVPRKELCEAEVGRVRHCTVLGTLRTGTACVGRQGTWWLLSCH